MINKDKDASITYPFQIFINNTLFSLLYNNGQGIDKGFASEMYNVTYYIVHEHLNCYYTSSILWCNIVLE